MNSREQGGLEPRIGDWGSRNEDERLLGGAAKNCGLRKIGTSHS